MSKFKKKFDNLLKNYLIKYIMLEADVVSSDKKETIIIIKKKKISQTELWNVLDKFKKEIDINDSYASYEFNDETETKLDKNICTFCNNNDTLINSKDGLVTCQECGSILDHIIDHTAEWRFYGCEDSKSSDPTRCGLPINELLPQSSLGSIISGNSRGIETYDMRKIRKYHTWNAMPYRERSLYNVFDTLQIRAINNGIPVCIIEDAKVMYKVLSEARISRGSNRKGLIASCIYIACKKGEVPRSAKEIADIFKLNITDMTRGCKKFIEIWNMVNKDKTGNINLSASQPNDFIQRFCSKLNVSNDIIQLCQYISSKAEEYSLVSENTPPSIAAGSIYLACQIQGVSLSKKDISEACKISEVTISKCYKKLEKYRDHIVPERYK